MWTGIFKYDDSVPSCLIRDYNVSHRNQHGTLIVHPTKGKPTGRLSRRGYWEVGYMEFLYKVHRIIWEIHNGEIPEGMYIDHIDGNRSNNKICNLRLVSSKINSRNSKAPSSNKTGIVGVSHLRDKDGTIIGYRSVWCLEDGSQKNKYFSFKKYGEELALLLAQEYRQHQIDLLNLQGAGYTDRHGSFE
ncbi:hypothetical protein D3C85_1208470 [compost metagenome]